ncbi:single-stranded DNA-binding protein [Candidatus Gracilibacteria bacterium 28_42_T64]|nr:single-stranded DNA-binding protein [Candidatus Gracilibacteria bacterium 28_42_T64]
MDLNKAQVIGRITQDLELKQTPNGQNVLSFSVATNRNWTDSSGMRQEQVEFHNIVLWAKLAEIAGQYLKKGSKIFMEGRLQTRSWEAQDGTKRYRTEIVGENMIMLDSKGDDTQSFGSNSSSTGNDTPAVKKSSPKKEEEISVEDIPF